MTRQRFLRLINRPLYFQLFLLARLPAAWFMGIRLRRCDGLSSEVTLPFSWRSQNPFRSIYFAAQCAAGELSTGVLAMAALQDRPPLSMLVISLEAEFLKKADQTLRFTCSDGPLIEAAIQRALESRQPQVLVATATGCLPDGTEAARVRVTWSFKARMKSSKAAAEPPY